MRSIVQSVKKVYAPEPMKEQKHLAMLLLLWRIPTFVTSLFAAVASRSIVVWMEFVEDAGVVIPGIILLVLSIRLSKNLKFLFNYGIGKVEAIAALVFETFDLGGLMFVVGFALRQLIHPHPQGEFMLTALAVQALGVLFDLFVMWREWRLVTKKDSRMIHAAGLSAQKEFGFDMIAFVTLVIGYIFRDSTWIVYFSPVVCLLLVVPFLVVVIRHMSSAIVELADVTLDEESQMKLLRILTACYDEYQTMGMIRSRRSGNQVFLDIELSFPEDETYRDIRATAKKIEEQIAQELGKCRVNIVLI